MHTEITTQHQRVLVSILNWNGARKTINCINSLLKHHPTGPELQYSVFVIDNGSEEEDKREITEFCKNQSIQILHLHNNTGFTGGHNISLKKSIKEKFDFCYLLNNDCTFESETLTALIKPFSEDRTVGATSTAFAYEDTKKTYFCGAVQNWQTLSSKWSEPDSMEDFLQTHGEKVWAVATGLMVSRQTIQIVGLLEESLFAYCEDDDYGQRIIRSNLKTIIVKQPVVLHGPSPKAGELRSPYFYYLTSRNHARFYLSYTPKKFRTLLRLRIILHSTHRAELLKKKSGSPQYEATRAGCAHAFSRKMGPPPKEFKINWAWRLIFLTANIINKTHSIAKSHT